MNIIILPVGQLSTNCYLVIDRKVKQCLIIDPGDDADYIQRVVADEGVKPLQIIATHAHFDHILAATELQLAYNIPFTLHKKDEFLLKRMQDSARYFTGVNAGPPPKISGYLKAKQMVRLGNTSFSIIETPGHTPGSITLYCRKEKLAFVGDLLFAEGGVGRTDFSYSSFNNLKRSIQKILKLSPGTLLLPGHGPQTTVSAERKYHPVQDQNQL